MLALIPAHNEMGHYTEYTVCAAATANERFDCRRCGHTDEARATMSNQRTRKTAGWGHSETERENHGAEIAKDARATALQGAKAIIRLAPCPKCGERDASHVREHVILAVLKTLVAVGVAVGLAALTHHLFVHGGGSKATVGIGFASGIFALAALVQAFTIPSQARMLYREAPELVTFGGAELAARRALEPLGRAPESHRVRGEHAKGAKARARIASRRAQRPTALPI